MPFLSNWPLLKRPSLAPFRRSLTLEQIRDRGLILLPYTEKRWGNQFVDHYPKGFKRAVFFRQIES